MLLWSKPSFSLMSEASIFAFLTDARMVARYSGGLPSLTSTDRASRIVSVSPWLKRNLIVSFSPFEGRCFLMKSTTASRRRPVFMPTLLAANVTIQSITYEGM